MTLPFYFPVCSMADFEYIPKEEVKESPVKKNEVKALKETLPVQQPSPVKSYLLDKNQPDVGISHVQTKVLETGIPKTTAPNMVWVLKKGKTIRENLEEWARLSNTGGSVVWSAPYDMVVKNDVVFRGLYESALMDLFNTTMKFDRPLYGIYWKKNHVIEVTDHWEERNE